MSPCVEVENYLERFPCERRPPPSPTPAPRTRERAPSPSPAPASDPPAPTVEDFEEDNCYICNENNEMAPFCFLYARFNNADESNQCGHQFHFGCLNEWYTSTDYNINQNRIACPLCRRDTMEIDYIEDGEWCSIGVERLYPLKGYIP